MEIGDKVIIKGTDNIWEDKTGVLEYIDEYMGTVLVDFIDDKKVRQDFDVDKINPIEKPIETSEEPDIVPADESKSPILKEDLKMDVEKAKQALADYLGVDPETISEDNNAYSVDLVLNVEDEDSQYLICTEDEARAKAEEEVRQSFEDMGLEAFTESFQEWILANAVDGDFFRDMQTEYYENYVNDIEYENDDEFENRLYAELYENDLLKDEDFEDGDTVNSLKEEVYDKLEDLKAEYVDILVNNEDPMDFLNGMYSGRELADFIMENNAIDIDKVAEEAVDEDGVAHFIAYYDGDEIDLGDDLFAYRIN